MFALALKRRANLRYDSHESSARTIKSGVAQALNIFALNQPYKLGSRRTAALDLLALNPAATDYDKRFEQLGTAQQRYQDVLGAVQKRIKPEPLFRLMLQMNSEMPEAPAVRQMLAQYDQLLRRN